MALEGAPFVPPFCPRPACPFHTCSDGWRWTRHGVYRRQCEPRCIPRFRCSHCRHTFSAQTFSTSYWLKRPELLPAVFHRQLACSGYRQMSREMGCDPTTAQRQSERLGRHALLYLYENRPRGPLVEPLVFDGLETFEYSQYHPVYLNLAVGAESHYFYAFTESELRRKGRMTAAQKRRRSRLEALQGRPDPRAIEKGTAMLLRLAVPEPQAVVLRSDEHEDYPRALRRLPGWDFRHERTSSREARTPGNPLFPVNLADLLLRHNGANLKRETIAFSKRRQGIVERAAVVAVWRNFIKPFSERHGGGTPAMRLGLRREPLSVDQFLSTRLFPSRVKLPAEWERYYRRDIPSREIAHPKRHTLKLAY